MKPCLDAVRLAKTQESQDALWMEFKNTFPSSDMIPYIEKNWLNPMKRKHWASYMREVLFNCNNELP